ncbi:MAG TPA: serine/threonine-protein kinase [Gemmatimonadales bacterium]|jgi:tRNA A-37 threonylcarbamoyl transferase component Bud32|nr:serine/threonine-protein kinase [Gemmatimonadales bacterium]
MNITPQAFAEPDLVPEVSAAFRAGLAQRGIDLEAEVGRSAMSVVYRAADRRHDRAVALKVMQASSRTRYDADRFLREIQVAAGLQHPHILPVYGSGAIDGTLFYVMPYVEGESLRSRLNRAGRLPLDQVLRIAREVSAALDYAHGRGVIHRDIKPENILLEAGHAVLADFGIATLVGRTSREPTASGGGSDPRITGKGLVVGTPAYMSPEQASGDATVDGRSDLYALGCVLYEALTGSPPFPGRTAQATIARRFQGPPVPIRTYLPGLPPAVASAIERALALDPADRYSGVADFASALAAAEHGRSPGVGTLRRAGVGIAVASLAIAAIAFLAAEMPRHHRTRFNPSRVAVAALSNETGDTALTSLGDMVASWVTDRLGNSSGVSVVTSAIVVPAHYDQHIAGPDVDDPERLERLAGETHAGTLVSGSYYRGAEGAVEFHVEITDANSGRLLRAIGPIISLNPEQTAADLSRIVAAAVDSLVKREVGPTRSAPSHPR